MRKFIDGQLVIIRTRTEKMKIVAYRSGDDLPGGSFANYGQYLCEYLDKEIIDECGRDTWVHEPDLMAIAD